MIRSKLYLFVILSACLFLCHCRKVERVMMVSTGVPDSISAISAIISGRVIDTGEDATAYGHCYSRAAGASYNDLKTRMVGPSDDLYFRSSLTSLEPGTKYYVRAYIKTDQSVTYGKEISFTTLAIDPVYKSSVIENHAPSVIELIYDIQLSNVVPSCQAFTVIVNSVTVPVSRVEIKENKILLTLANALGSEDSITVTYSKPVSNPLQSNSGGLAASFTEENVLNNLIPPPPAPVFEQAAIENAAPGIIEMKYSLSLAAGVPDVSAFTVMVNSERRNVTVVAISSTKVLLTMENPASAGDQVTLSYSKPDNNPLQSVAGGIAGSLSDRSVTNNIIPPPSIPVFEKAVVENAAPFIIEVVYSLPLANIVPDISAFTAAVNSISVTISQIAILGSKVLLILANQVAAGDLVTVSYTASLNNPVQTSSGGLAATMPARIAANNIIPVIPAPVFEGAVIENATPAIVEMNYSLPLANIIPDISAFSIFVNSQYKSITSVAITGDRVFLTLANAVNSGDQLSVSYTKPLNNQLQTASGGMASSITGQNVTNNIIPPPLEPVFTGASVESEAPALLKMCYSLPLANIVPDISAFTVTVNSIIKNVSQVSVTENRILLNLTNAVAFGDIVTVSYTKPVTNPVQTLSGGMAQTISAQNVINNAGPECLGAVVNDGSPTIIEMNFNSELAGIIPSMAAFNVSVNSGQMQIISVAVTGTKVFLNLSGSIVYGDIVAASYAKPLTNPLQSVSGKIVQTFPARAVTNNVKPASPVYLAAVVENSTPALLEMTYDLTLANIVPAVSAFTVKVNSFGRIVSSVSISGNKVILILSKSVRRGEIVTVAYTKPSVNALQTPSGGQAVTISAQTVRNNLQ